MIAAAVAALALALPQHGVVVPGKSFGGLSLGATAAQVKSTWGTRFGTCRGCADTTWYFTYKPFEPEGAGISFRAGAAVAFFTIWSPPGWQTDRGLRVGDPAERVTELYGALPRVECGTYSAIVLRTGRTATQFYLYQGEVWGFGLTPAGAQACR